MASSFSSPTRSTAGGLVSLLAAMVWALPWTLFGLLLGCLGLLTGGQVQRVGRVVEFCGGGVAWLLENSPLIGGASAITFGHVVLAQTLRDLDTCREHELVHVRQYQRWGLLFIPAYLTMSAVRWLQGRHPYFDNPFEVEAYKVG
jgi:hypothetical protein